jgi:3-oxosteroid 1-dehydrogenase
LAVLRVRLSDLQKKRKRKRLHFVVSVSTSVNKLNSRRRDRASQLIVAPRVTAIRERIMGCTEYEADVIVLGFGGAGACAAVEAHDAGASVIVIERQVEETHYSNTRMSGGGYHSPHPLGDRAALKEYAKAMFSGENLSVHLDGELADFSDEYASIWSEMAPENDEFVRSLDPDYKPMVVGGAAFPEFPGAEKSRYAVVRASYVGTEGMIWEKDGTIHREKLEKENGEALHFCLLNGLKTRGIPVHYETRGRSLIIDDAGRVTGLKAMRGDVEV